jgi:transcriptional regulator with XRE-family HTH domain
MIITSEQVRAARKLLGWSSIKTAVRSSVGVNLIKRIEGRRREPTQEMLNRLQSTFEAAGVEFNAGGAGGPGVRLRTSNDEAAIPPVPPGQGRLPRPST